MLGQCQPVLGSAPSPVLHVHPGTIGCGQRKQKALGLFLSDFCPSAWRNQLNLVKQSFSLLKYEILLLCCPCQTCLLREVVESKDSFLGKPRTTLSRGWGRGVQCPLATDVCLPPCPLGGRCGSGLGILAVEPSRLSPNGLLGWRFVVLGIEPWTCAAMYAGHMHGSLELFFWPWQSFSAHPSPET